MPAPDPDPIALLLDGRYPDPETGELLRAESRAVVIEDSLAGSEAELVASLGVDRHVAVVSDANTHAALGARVERALAGRFAVQSIVLGRAPAADADTVGRLRALLEPRTDAIVAVGGGTLNDLTKMVALDRGCPQLVFATAPSMNGYTSLSASITSEGLKRSFRARTPVGAFFDLHVLAAAPPRLIRAGIGDSLCRSTAQADWLLSHLLLGRPYREAPFALLAADERALIEQTPALLAGELPAMRHLVRTLVLSGFGMTICNGSYPASQGEHLLGHYIEMMHPPELSPGLHGEQMAVCTTAMARLQDAMLALDAPPVLRPGTLDRAAIVAHFGPAIGEACWEEALPKRLDAARAEELTAQLATGWGAMRDAIARVTLGAARTAEVLAAAGAPVAPGELGWPAPLWEHARRHARELRDRYTFLDLAADAGHAGP